MEQERLVSATDARKIIEKRLGKNFSQSKMTRLMQSGALPSQPSVLDARKRLIKLSDLENWLVEAEKELEGRPALALTY